MDGPKVLTTFIINMLNPIASGYGWQELLIFTRTRPSCRQIGLHVFSCASSFVLRFNLSALCSSSSFFSPALSQLSCSYLNHRVLLVFFTCCHPCLHFKVTFPYRVLPFFIFASQQSFTFTACSFYRSIHVTRRKKQSHLPIIHFLTSVIPNLLPFSFIKTKTQKKRISFPL
jgi:hypothetical protein